MFKELCQKAFPKSLWVYHCNVGACNGCDIEVIDVLTASPRHADVLLVCGPVTRQVVPALKRLYDAVPDPKLVIAIGSCAVGGGIWFDSYNIVGGADTILPVDYYIPGCPPRPEAILHGVAVALGLAEKEIESVHLKQLPDRPESVPVEVE